MPSRAPRVFLRIGTHAEKDYFEKTFKFFDGLIIGANLIESTPGATASLLVKLCGQAKLKKPYYIDPMTYAFGAYAEDGKVLRSLDWIKSEQKKKDGRVTRDFKRSYKALSKKLGGLFDAAIGRSTALATTDFQEDLKVEECCKSVVSYQNNRIREEFAKDEEFKAYAELVSPPAAIIAPYFYNELSQVNEWFRLNMRLASATVASARGRAVHAVVCIDQAMLESDKFLDIARTELLESGVKGVWFWFSRLHEDATSVEQLRRFRALVEGLSEKLDVYNMHGGYWSLALSRFGLSGVAHGVGYGEQKDVLPVIGQSTPTVRYYLPAVHKRLGVPQIERCFNALKIESPEDFYEKVCGCVICRGVVTDNLGEFNQFGDMHYSREESKRLAQTPAAAKRCRFHFLLSRMKERDWMQNASSSDIVAQLKEAMQTWGQQASLRNEVSYLQSWIESLS